MDRRARHEKDPDRVLANHSLMKRRIAFVVYYVGAAWVLALLLQFGREGFSWDFLLLLLVGVAISWITAGIGIRLGLYPSEFFRAFGRFAGLLDPPRAHETSQD